MTIIITQGIYNGDTPYKRDGYFHEETRIYLPLPLRFRQLLLEKWLKFNEKYGVEEIPFTLGRDAEDNIEAIAICHTTFDKFSEKIGESIVIGRIKRMRGDIRKPYNLYKRHRIKKKDGTVIAGELVYPYIYKFAK